MINRSSQGRPPLARIYRLVRDQYRWFDYLKKRRGDPFYRALEDTAWASWRPVLKTLRGLHLAQADIHKAVTLGKSVQFTLDLEKGGEK